MKNQIDQSTPFLAFYDLLRIRGIYADEEKREKLRRGFRRAMALAAVFVGLLLPQGARARENVNLPDATGQPNYAISGNVGTFSGNGGTWKWDSGTGFNVGSGYTVRLGEGGNGTGRFIFVDKSGARSDVGGTVQGPSADFVLVNPDGIQFNGAQINVSALVAAAMNYDGDPLGAGKNHDVKLVTGNVTGSYSGSPTAYFIGRTVSSGLSGTKFETGSDGLDNGATFSMTTENGGTITFSGNTAAGVKITAGKVEFANGSEVAGDSTTSVSATGDVEGDFSQSDGTVTAGGVIGKLTQSGGSANVTGTIASLEQTASAAPGTTASAANITTLVQRGANASATATTAIGSLTQSAGTVNAAQITGVANQTGGTIDTGAATTLSVGAGSTLGSGTVTAGTVSVGSGSGALTLSGNGLSGKTINAGAVTLGGEAGQVYSVSGAISSLATSGETAGAVTVSKTGTGALSLGSIHAASLSASTAGGGITQSGATAISGGGNVTLNAGAGTINLSQGVSGAGTLTLASNNGGANAVQVSGGTVSAGTITMGGSAKTLSQSGGNITVSGANFLTESDTLAQSGGSASFVSSAAAVNQSGSGTINATTLSGSVTQTGGTIAGKDGGNLTLSQAITTQNGTLDASGATLRLADGSTVSGTVRADTIEGGAFTQNDGTIEAATISNDKLTQTVGIISGVAENGDLSITKTLDQNGGSINLGSGTLTLGSASTSAGDITAGKIDAGTTTLTQDGAGTITVTGADGIKAATITQTANAGTINATAVNGTVTQEGGTIQNESGNLAFNTAFADGSQKGTILASGTITLASGSTVGGTVKADNIALSGTGTKTLTQNGANSAITVSGGSFLASDGQFTQKSGTLTLSNTDNNTVNASVTQDGGKIVGGNITLGNHNITQASGAGIEATTLTLGENGQAYALTGANKVATLSSADGTTQSAVTINNGENALAIDGVKTANGLTISSAGAVTDGGTGVAAGSVKIESSTKVVLDNTANINIAGLASSGDVALNADGIVLNNNTVSGANVTIANKTAGTALDLDGNISATGDILVKSEGALTTGFHTLETSGGNIVLSGAGVTVNGSTLSAAAKDGVGIQSSAALTVQNATITAPTVILETTGAEDLTVGNGVSMNASASTTKDAALIVKAENEFSMPLDTGNRPSSKLTITKGTLDLTSANPDGKVIDLDQFAYKTTGDVKIDFRGKMLALESDGNVTVKTSQDVTIAGFEAMTTEGGTASGEIEASNATGGTAVKVSASGTGTQTPTDGLVGSSVTLDTSTGGSVTVAEKAKISSSGDLTLATANGKDFTVAEGGTVESTAGSVSITSKGALDVAGTVQTHSVSSISLKTEGTGENAKDIAISGTVDAGLNGSGGSVILDSATDKIVQSGSSSFIEGMKVIATGETIEQSGGILRTHGADDQGGIVASKVVQSGPGTIVTTKIDGDFEQTDAAGAARLLKHSSASTELVVTGSAVQKSGNAIIGGSESTRLEFDGPDSAVTLGSLDQDAGTINATTLTLRDDSTSGGTITAGSIVVQTDGAASPDKTLTQDRAGTITADSITASTVEQSHAGTDSAHATINADTINADTFTQSGAYASASAKTVENGITITGAATQSGADATIGAAGQNVTLQGGATQDGHGKVLADTLTLAGDANAYDLDSTEGNAVSTIEGTAKTVEIHDDTTDLAFRVNVGTGDGNTVSVLKAGDVTLDGVTAKSITVNEAGDVVDTANQTAATTVALGDAANNKTVGNVTLKNGTGAITVEGINASGDVGIRNASITQNGAISGKNVTLDQTAGTLTVGKNVTATEGDIFVHSTDKVEVGDATTAPALSAANGSIVVKGENEVTIDNANLTAKEIGVEATTEAAATKLTLKNVQFVTTGTGDGMDGVVLKSGGYMTIDTGVAAKTSADATKNEAQVTISAGGELSMASGQPTAGEKLSVSAGSIGGIDITNGDTLDVNSFVYTHNPTDETKKDLDFKFTGSKLSILNEKGAVTVTTDGQDLSIVKSAATGNDDVKIEALDVTAATAGTKESVEIADSGAAGSDGIVAKDNIKIEVDGTKNGTVKVEGTVSSTAGTVSITSGGAIDVAAGGKVETLATGKGITLTSGNAKDITIAGATINGNTTVSAGEVVSKGDLTMTSAKDIALAGTVSATAGTATLKAESGEVKQTAGTVSVKDLDILAKDISQSGTDTKSITATGETSLEATHDSISLAATTGTGDAVAPANDFATISKAVAKKAIAISDKNALTIAGAAGSEDGTTATTDDISITAVDALTVTAAVNAGGDATLSAKTIKAQSTVTAGKKVTATATGTDTDTAKAATFAGAVTGGTDVELTAASGTLKTDAAVEATTGDATLSAKTVAAGGAVTAGKKVTATATGADTDIAKAAAFAGAVTGGTDVELTVANGTLQMAAVTAGSAGTAGSATLTAGTIAAQGEVKAEKGKVSATSSAAGGATFDQAVTGQEVSLTANGDGKLTTKDAVTATAKDAVLKGASVDAQGTVTASSGLVSMTATAGTVQTKAVSGQNVAFEATTGVTEGDVVSAPNDKFVHTTGGDIMIAKDFSAKNAVYKADDGNIVVSDKISGVTDGLGLEGNGLTVDGTKISGVKTLVVNSKTGDVTLTGKPEGVQTLAVAAGGNVTVGGGANGETAVEGDFTFTDGRVVVSVPNGKAEADRTVNVTGLQAGNDLKVNITGTLTTPAATAGGNVDIDAGTVNMANGTVTATRGNVDIDATTANVGTATAGGAVTVDATDATVDNATANGGIAAVRTTTGTATVGNLSGTSAEVSSQNGNVVLTGTATARTGNANVTAANGTVTGGGNVTARNGGVATVNGTSVRASSIAGDGGTRVTARTGNVTVSGAIGDGGNTTVSAADDVGAGSITAEGTVSVTAGGSITATAGAIAGGAGTTVTKNRAGGTISAAGNDIGEGGATTIDANGAAVTAGRLVSGAGNALDVNDAGAVNAAIAAGGDAQIQAASLEAGTTAAGGNLTFDTVTGAANVGTLAVVGDVNGTVDGLFTTAGGAVGSIGQQGGGFNALGGATVNGNLNSGAVQANTGAFTVNGALNAGGAAVVLNSGATTLNGPLTGGNVTINAGGPVTGAGALTAGQLNIAAGGSEINLPNVQSANLNNITGGNITLTDTSGQQITIGTIDAGGVLDLTLNSAAGTAGGANLSANGTMTLTVNGPFGTIAAPCIITIDGGNPVLNIDGSGIDGSLLHFILNGDLDPGDIEVNYLGEGFAIYGSQATGWQIVGIGPEKQRLLNRALAFTVNTPELKSKQGIFGDPAMVHTKMNVSEARPGANMDMLALKSVDFSETWKDVSESGGDLAEWTPAVFVDEAPLLPKLEALASEVQLQPEIQPMHGSENED